MLRTQRKAAGAAASVALLAAVLTGCAYEYDEGLSSENAVPSAAPTSRDAAIPQDPSVNQPVSGADLDAWMLQVLPDTKGETFETGIGTLEVDEERTDTTAQLPKGTYSLTLACRSTSRVAFSVENGDTELLDLNLRCGTSRVSVITLAADSILSIKVDSSAPANFAYRIARI